MKSAAQGIVRSQIFSKRVQSFDQCKDLPLEQYWCKGCGDKFVFQSSYVDHMWRKSINISYFCKYCEANIQFFNRCSLLHHYKMHGQLMSAFNLADVTVEPLNDPVVTLTLDLEADENTVDIDSFIDLKEKNLIKIEDDIPITKPPFFCDDSKVNVASIDTIIKKINNAFDSALNEHLCDDLLVEATDHQNTQVLVDETFSSQRPPICNNQTTKISNNHTTESGDYCSIEAHNTQILQSVGGPTTLVYKTQTQFCEAFLQTQDVTAEDGSRMQCTRSTHDSQVTNKDNDANSNLSQINNLIANPVFLLDTSENGQENTLSTSPAKKSQIKKQHSLPGKRLSNQLPTHYYKKVASNVVFIPVADDIANCNRGSCTFCSYDFTSHEGIMKMNRHIHFNEFKTLITCQYCKLQFVNECSYTAHMSIHTAHQMEFVCPECGQLYNSPFLYYKHVMYTCFHLTKVVVFRCEEKNCTFVYLHNYAAKHFISKHATRYFKCVMCSTSFTKKRDFVNHMKELHTKANIRALEHYLCHPCTKQLTVAGIQIHTQTNHKASEHLLYFICPGCHTMHLALIALKTHIKSCIPYSNSEYARYLTQVQELCVLSTVGNKGVSCQSKLCETCQITYLYKRIDKRKLNVCIYCNLNKANKFKHGDIETLNANASLQLTGIKRKAASSLKPKGKRLVKKEPKAGKSSDNTLKTKKRRRNWYKRKTFGDSDASQGNSGLALSSSSADREEFTCAKCKFTSNDRYIFTSHIMTHRNPSTAFQCMDCGLGFVIKGSLASHLMIMHGLKDTNKYIIERNCENKSVVADLEDEGKKSPVIKDNQCKVCLDEFKSSADLDKHFRIHGMAFILANQKNKTSSV